MVSITLPNWSKPLLTFGYSASGWLLTEIPVLLGVLPASVDGYSTTSAVAGLTFILSGAYYVHSHLKPYIVTTTTAAAAQNVMLPSTSNQSSVQASSPSSSPAPAGGFTLSASASKVVIGQPITFTLANGTPSGTYRLYQSGEPMDASGQLTSELSFDAAGKAVLNYNLTPASPIGGVLAAENQISLYAYDEEADVESSAIIITT
jgi:hypothetical protein